MTGPAITSALLRLRADPPLDPEPGEAREALRRELLHPDYNRDGNLLQRLLDWLNDRFNGGVDAGSTSPALQTFMAMLVMVLLVGVLVWLLLRVNGSTRRRRTRTVFTEETITAAQLRSRAEAALREGRHGEALVDAFRALARRQVERGRIDDLPGATAGELSRSLAMSDPAHADAVLHAGRLFDDVLYGEREARADQVRDILALDDALAVAR